MPNTPNRRRDFLKQTAGAAAVTGSLLARPVKAANEKISVAFIGVGRMGRSNLHFAMQQPEVEIVAICDVYQPCLNLAMKMAGGRPKPIKDFRQILEDKSIDAVCVATPDHWHPYLTVEACKAGKDVYVEKPISVTVDEGRSSTTHTVTVWPSDIDRYAPHADPEDLLRASFEFLLEREPKESILRSFELPVIERYFPEYPAAMRQLFP